jgi:hypothetical protein
MILKEQNLDKCCLNELELLGNDEVAITKALAYIFSKSYRATSKVLKYIDPSYKFSKKDYLKSKISIEKYRKSGRTDIEIECENDLHLIIEAKIKKNKLNNQRKQYLNEFNKNTKKNIMCFVTSERTVLSDALDYINVKFLTWRDIQSLLSDIKFTDDTEESKLVKKYLRFYERRIKMREQKEVLIQDLSKPSEIKRFKENQIYKRPETFGIPLYFAPHFTKNANQDEGVGISHLSKVLGVLTIKAADIVQYKEDLNSFANNDKKLVSIWLKGMTLGNKSLQKELRTYYFLDSPVEISPSLQKDGGVGLGRGKNWIAGMIPPNRCVSFSEFAKRMSSQSTLST